MAGRSQRGSASRLLALAVGIGLASAALAARAAAVARTVTTAAARVEDWVELTVVGGAALAGAWVALGAVLGLTVVLTARAGAHWRAGEAVVRALAPAGVHRLVRAGITASVGAGLVLAPTTALAAPPAAPPAAATVPSQTGAPTDGDGGTVDLSWRPTSVPLAGTAGTAGTIDATWASATPPPSDHTAAPAPAPAPEPAPAPTPEPEAAPVSHRVTPPHVDGSVVVLRGDTLWDVAANWLGGNPSDAEIMAATAAWHEANRSVIGDDADVILPGQVLVPPA